MHAWWGTDKSEDNPWGGEGEAKQAKADKAQKQPAEKEGVKGH